MGKILEEHERISLIAMQIHNAYEDNYFDKEKRKQFETLFDRFLEPLDPNATMEPYEIIIMLGRKKPKDFEQMIKEMKDLFLIPA